MKGKLGPRIGTVRRIAPSLCDIAAMRFSALGTTVVPGFGVAAHLLATLPRLLLGLQEVFAIPNAVVLNSGSDSDWDGGWGLDGSYCRRILFAASLIFLVSMFVFAFRPYVTPFFAAFLGGSRLNEGRQPQASC